MDRGIRLCGGGNSGPTWRSLERGVGGGMESGVGGDRVVGDERLKVVEWRE